MADLPITNHTMLLLRDVGEERARQNAKWGEQNHPDSPVKAISSNAFFGIPSEAAAKALCEDAFRRGIGSYGHILLEEVAEAFAAIGDERALRAELVQVAAVAIAWSEAIDRRCCAAAQAPVPGVPMTDPEACSNAGLNSRELRPIAHATTDCRVAVYISAAWQDLPLSKAMNLRDQLARAIEDISGRATIAKATEVGHG